MVQKMLFDVGDICGRGIPGTSCVARVKNSGGRQVLGKRFARCAAVIGDIRMGEAIHYVSVGEWSLHDLLVHVLLTTGPAAVDICTWSVSEDGLRVMLAAIDDGMITDLRALLDWRVKVRRPEAYQLLRSNLASANICLCNTHAKVATVQNTEWAVSIVGSANLTNNPRIEAGVITCDETVTRFHREWFSAELRGATPFEDA